MGNELSLLYSLNLRLLKFVSDQTLTRFEILMFKLPYRDLSRNIFYSINLITFI